MYRPRRGPETPYHWHVGKCVTSVGRVGQFLGQRLSDLKERAEDWIADLSDNTFRNTWRDRVRKGRTEWMGYAPILPLKTP